MHKEKDIVKVARTIKDDLSILLDDTAGQIISEFDELLALADNGEKVGDRLYFPVSGYSSFYDKQEFTATGWGELLKLTNNSLLEQ